MEPIPARLINLPCRIPGLSAVDENGEAMIFLNARLSHEQRQRCYAHELRHLQSNDFHNPADIQTIELLANDPALACLDAAVDLLLSDIPLAPIPAHIPAADIPLAPIPAHIPAADVPSAPIPAHIPAADVPSAPIPANIPAADVPSAPIPAAGVPATDVPLTHIPAHVRAANLSSANIPAPYTVSDAATPGTPPAGALRASSAFPAPAGALRATHADAGTPANACSAAGISSGHVGPGRSFTAASTCAGGISPGGVSSAAPRPSYRAQWQAIYARGLDFYGLQRDDPFWDKLKLLWFDRNNPQRFCGVIDDRIDRFTRRQVKTMLTRIFKEYLDSLPE